MADKEPPEIADIAEFTDELVTAILRIDEAMIQLSNARLTKRALLILLKDKTGLGMRELQQTLDALATLKSTYIKPKGE